MSAVAEKLTDMDLMVRGFQTLSPLLEMSMPNVSLRSPFESRRTTRLGVSAICTLAKVFTMWQSERGNPVNGKEPNTASLTTWTFHRVLRKHKLVIRQTKFGRHCLCDELRLSFHLCRPSGRRFAFRSANSQLFCDSPSANMA